MSHNSVLIIDFGSQVTQLIARRIREFGVFCEVKNFNIYLSNVNQLGKLKNVIFKLAMKLHQELLNTTCSSRY